METTSSDLVPLVVGALICGVVIAFGIYSYRSQYRRADELVLRWAAQNNYEILDKEDANPPGTGPKDRYASNKQVMYRVTVRDGQGRRKRALLKLGDKLVGTMKDDDLSVEWEP